MLEFQYGDPSNQNDRLAAFTWNINDQGYNTEKLAYGYYCSMEDHLDDDGDSDGSIWTCWFPGW